MHNRARMITASFLTRNLGIDWRHGYQHFGSLLADGDVANNAGNWQWVAGTGNNTRPNRVMNPLRQARRFNRSGQYVARYLPKLAGLDPAWIQTPWKLPPAQRARLGYRARSWSCPETPGPFGSFLIPNGPGVTPVRRTGASAPWPVRVADWSLLEVITK
jgi:deoxyribodipyrimidine photolyase